jgi:hypothetical protein
VGLICKDRNTDVDYDLPWSFDDGIDVRLQRKFSREKVLVAIGLAYLKCSSKDENPSDFFNPFLFALNRLTERSGVDHAAKVLV